MIHISLTCKKGSRPLRLRRSVRSAADATEQTARAQSNSMQLRALAMMNVLLLDDVYCGDNARGRPSMSLGGKPRLQWAGGRLERVVTYTVNHRLITISDHCLGFWKVHYVVM